MISSPRRCGLQSILPSTIDEHDEHLPPFEDKQVTAPTPIRVLYRFHKPGLVAGIRERRVTRAAPSSFSSASMPPGGATCFTGRSREYLGSLKQLCASPRADERIEDLTRLGSRSVQ